MIFSMWWSKKSTPQPRFLDSYVHLLSNYSCDVSKKMVACKWNWKVQRRQKIVKILKFFKFKWFFLCDGAKNRPPQPRFSDSYVHLLSNYTCDVSKKIVACKWNWKVQRRQKIVKILKFFNFKSFFLYDGAKNRLPQPRFLNSYFHLLSNYTCDVSKKIVACKWNWKVQRRQKIVKILKFFNFKSFFLYDGAKNRLPQPRFLNSYFHLLPYYSCDVSNKIVACKWNWKVQRRQKIVKILKFFKFKWFFLCDGAKNRPPNLGFWTLTFTFFQIILATFQKKWLRANETGKFKEGKK